MTKAAKPKIWITYEWLHYHGACVGQLDKFKEIYGDRVHFTRKNALAYSGDFDTYWFAKYALSEDNYEELLTKASKNWFTLKAPIDRDHPFSILEDNRKRYKLLQGINAIHQKWLMVKIWEYVSRRGFLVGRY